MALMQLVAVGQQNVYLRSEAHNIDNGLSYNSHFINETVTMNSINTNSYNAMLANNCDKIKLTSIIFDLNNSNMPISEFKDAIQNAVLDIYIGGSIVYKFNLSLLIELNSIQAIENSMNILIPDYFSKEIFLKALYHHQVKVQLSGANTELFNSVKISTEQIFAGNVEANNLIQYAHEQFIPTLETQTINYENTSQFVPTNLNFDHCVKGYFIECDNIDNLTNVKLSLNGHDRYDYDRTMLNIIGHKISNRLMYLPFVNKKNYMDSSRYSYHGSLNHSRIDTTKLITKFNNVANPFKLKIHALNFNILRYLGGMGGIAYTTTSYGEYTSNIALTPTVITQIQIIYKPLNSTIMCPISYENIEINYAECISCHNKFDYDSAMHWVDNHHNCPMCRSNWGDTIQYKNMNQPNEEIN